MAGKFRTKYQYFKLKQIFIREELSGRKGTRIK